MDEQKSLAVPRGLRPGVASPRRWGWYPRAAFWTAVALAAAASFMLPAVRASAQSFLMLFRVVNFAAVPVSPARASALEQIDLERLVGDRVQMLRDPGRPLPMTSLDQAADAAGLALRLPAWLPPDTVVDQIAVRGERRAVVTADSARLRSLMDALGITDLEVPPGLDGQRLEVSMPPMVMIRYLNGQRGTRLFQSRTPQVTMPAGVPVAALGEIGLRLLGLEPVEAREFAARIDWNTTLLLPLPPGAAGIRQVEISGNRGIAVIVPGEKLQTGVVLWSNGGRVYGLMSVLPMSQLLDIANSIP